jgi:hypothetical protein
MVSYPLRKRGNGNSSNNIILFILRWLALVLVVTSFTIVWKLANHHDGGVGLVGVPSSREWRLEAATYFSKEKLSNDDGDKCQKAHEYATRQYPRWTPGWTPDDMERSRALVGNRHRLALLAEKLTASKQPILGVVCGGSISLGHGVAPTNMRYSDRLEVWLNDRFPLTNQTENNGIHHQVLNRGSHGADVSRLIGLYIFVVVVFISIS